MSILLYLANIRRQQIQNVGFNILFFAILIPLLLGMTQFFMLLNHFDLKIIIALGILGAALSYSLMGLGFIIMLLVIERNLFLSQAQEDTLTKLYNRRGLENSLQHSLAYIDQGSSQNSLVLCDIDNFKKVNDVYGHDAGDSVLISFANTLKSFARQSDILARYGGEEFIFILPHTTSGQAEVFAERVRKQIEKTEIIANNQHLKVTASFGIANQIDGIDLEQLIQSADKALYYAKEHGKNLVYVHDADLNTDL